MWGHPSAVTAGYRFCEIARTRQAAYRARFGFPFVIAVKGLSRYQIMDALEARLANDRATEFRACLAQIARIARFRLDALLGPAT